MSSSRNSSISNLSGSAGSGGGGLERSMGRSGAPSPAPSNAVSNSISSRSGARSRPTQLPEFVYPTTSYNAPFSPSMAIPMDWAPTNEGGNSSSGSRRGVQWADRVSSATSGAPAPLVSYSPTDVPSNYDEPRRAWDYPQLLLSNKSAAAKSGSGSNYGRNEYLDIASSTPRDERDFANERAISSAMYAESEHVPASNYNQAAVLDELLKKVGSGRCPP
jgi:hypothetical protein